jgi:hypothetical protein
MRISVTLEDIANKSFRAHQHVKNEHAIYMAEKKET